MPKSTVLGSNLPWDLGSTIGGVETAIEKDEREEKAFKFARIPSRPSRRPEPEATPYTDARHKEFLGKLSRPCFRGKGTAFQHPMEIKNLDKATTRAKKPINGFIYEEWPIFYCKRHNYSECF